MNHRFFSKRFVCYFICLFSALMIGGCMGLKGKNQPADGSPEPARTHETTAVYYDFEDVLIPKELSVVDKQTVVVSSPGFVSGIITLKGRVERTSLFNFFSNNMQKDNWNVVSQIKSPGTSIMVFQKSTRTAVITIRDEQINTWVEIGVAPTITAPEPMMALPPVNPDGLTETEILE